MTQSYLFLVRSQPVAGEAAEFNRWYDERHVPDLLAVPGIVSARRYRVVGAAGAPWGGTFIGIYEIETDDIEQVQAELARRYATPAMPRSDAVDSPNTFSCMAIEVLPYRRA